MLERPLIQGTELAGRPSYPECSPRTAQSFALSTILTAISRLRRSSVDCGGAPVTSSTNRPGDDPHGLQLGGGRNDTLRPARGAMSPRVSANWRHAGNRHRSRPKEERLSTAPRLLPGWRFGSFSAVGTSSGVSRWDEGQIVAQSLSTGERTGARPARRLAMRVTCRRVTLRIRARRWTASLSFCRSTPTR